MKRNGLVAGSILMVGMALGVVAQTVHSQATSAPSAAPSSAAGLHWEYLTLVIQKASNGGGVSIHSEALNAELTSAEYIGSKLGVKTTYPLALVNKLGADGWELVSFCAEPQETIDAAYAFKRLRK